MGEKFTVTLVKTSDGQKLGFGLKTIGETVVIEDIKSEGAIVTYNSDNPTKKVQLDDIINSVNGSSSKMEDIQAAAKKASGTIILEIERPKIWVAALHITAGGSLGLLLGDPERVYIRVCSNSKLERIFSND